MKPASTKRLSLAGISLMELLVATAIMSLIAIIGTKIMVEGSQYLRLNQMAIDAQRSGLALSTQVNNGLQTTKRNLIATDASGVVFASPFKPDGTAEYEVSDNKLKWQKWVCFYYDASAQKVTPTRTADRQSQFKSRLGPSPGDFCFQPGPEYGGDGNHAFSSGTSHRRSTRFWRQYHSRLYDRR
jgi:type II secretory pathway pseudopilin PulG